MRRRSNAYLWRSRGPKTSKKTRISSYPLTRVSFHNDSESNARGIINDYENDNDHFSILKTPELVCEEFENLKQNRIEQRKKKIKEFITSFKNFNS